MSATPTAYTAARISVWLGVSPQAVLKRLRTVPRTGLVIVNHRERDGWTVDKLPADLLRELREACLRERFGSVAQMLDATPRAYAPPLPGEAIAEHCWEHARKLKRALAPSLARRHDPRFTGAEFSRLGVADYVAEFGLAISPRHFHTLFSRVVDRDSGREQWDNEALYLPERLAKIDAPPAREPKQDTCECDEIVVRLHGCHDPGSPTEAEKADLWACILEAYDRLTQGRGEPPKRAKRQLCDFISARLPILAPTRDALLKSFDRVLAKRENKPADGKALRDQRRNNTGNHDGWQLPEEDRDLLITRAVHQHRGGILPAWQDFLRGGLIGQNFSAATLARYAGKSRGHYHMPTSVRESITPEVRIGAVLHQGAKAFDQIKGHVRRSYDGIASLRCFQADDVTFPVYWYVPDGHGWFNLVRGQLLVFIDFRTGSVLGFSLQPDRNYSWHQIRPLCTRVFEEFGVPDVLYFERGIWETSSLLKGRGAASSMGEISQGLREFNIHFMHAIRARSKNVERVIGRLQDLSEAEVGYCGRDERRDCPEATTRLKLAVERARTMPPEDRDHLHPARLGLRNYDQMKARLAEIVDEYNARAQGGHMLDGLSPEVALDQLRDLKNPPIQFDAALRCLFAAQKEIKPVTLNGITYRVGKNVFNYRGAEIAHLVGRKALLWFDPENPEIATVTDLDRRNPVCVERSQEPNALEALIAPDSGTLARELSRIEGQASYMKARFHVIKRKFPMVPRAFHNPEGAALAAQINERTAAARAGQRQRKKAQVHARAAGLALPPNSRIDAGDVDDMAHLEGFMQEGEN